MITSISHMFIFLSSTRRKTYRTRRVLVLDLEKVHGSDHGLHGHEDVLVDQLDVRPLLLIWKASSVDDLHLLDERRLARLASTCGKTQNVIKVCLCNCGEKNKFLLKSVISCLCNTAMAYLYLKAGPSPQYQAALATLCC